MTAKAALLAAALGFLPLAALAQEPPSRTPCPAVDDSKIPPALAGWLDRAPLDAASAAPGATKAVLPIGKGVDAKLKRTGEVAFPVLPAKPGGSVSYGGLYAVEIAEAGDYQVSLGTGAWIEVVSGKTLLEATAHAPGPACASLKKTVVFPLKPGRYLLEITGNADPTLAVMVSRVAR